ncbi:MAG: PhoH family protein [Actinobacteria bacterium]|nr:PhoH family protein [Actinomycetota bacterium]
MTDVVGRVDSEGHRTDHASFSLATAASAPAGPGTRTRIVLDTSVLVADPGCFHSFTGCDVVIPLTVVEELDGLKTRSDDVGRAARTALRTIEDLRRRAGGSIHTPVALGPEPESATVHIEVNGIQKHLLVENGLDPEVPDNRIIGAALGQSLRSPTRMVSNDAGLRIKAAHLGLEAAEHQPVGRTAATRQMGWSTLEVSAETVNDLYDKGEVGVAQFGAAGLMVNEFAVVRSGSQSALVRSIGDTAELLPGQSPEAWGLRARSKEQRFALELLLDPAVSVVALDGRAGTGKTVLAIAAGLEQVVEARNYERLAVYRPLVPVGRADVGFLPGGLDEKLDPWMSAIHDAIVALTDQRSSRDARGLIDDLSARGQLSMESVTFLRGRSLHRQFVVVDEAQNLEPTTLKTILTRIGEGTKVVFTGDTSQIDAPYMGESNNALAVLIHAFADQHLFGHITLSSCERSEVASLAAELL